ncbi:hypothetical protein VFPPC_18056 [Pochonia chlamydosporia 170]|uniref:Uncharacterized protein n=1 Tax=Pochonia chlamydosporia 170 TaxID=1380566 RepID=A0A219AQ12_METCM|nr:hypothetical protein VFPPC_18056 [Pochonia chlamydosporia 170]OWT42801.1 hypothetical protein VFPPC_18056 [Pochonia chlamydosporia 170]
MNDGVGLFMFLHTGQVLPHGFNHQFVLKEHWCRSCVCRPLISLSSSPTWQLMRRNTRSVPPTSESVEDVYTSQQLGNILISHRSAARLVS